MNKKTVKDIDLENKKVIMRADFNVPLDDNGNITDDTRIRAAIPTIKYILENKASLILMSHLGRPKGVVKEEMRLTPVGKRLSELLGIQVKKTDDCIGDDVKSQVSSLKSGEVLLLENLRFHKEETDNDEEFAKKLASFADIYVNDAFGTAHRAHASTVGIAKFIPAVSGFLLEKEIYFLNTILKNPERPFVVVLGGAKISTKMGVVTNLLEKVDSMLIGGGMIFTFLKSRGINIGKSILEPEKEVEAFEIFKKAKNEEKELIMPVDVIVADEISENAKTKTVDVNQIPDDMSGVDIGPKTIKLFKKKLQEAKTIIWNGPMGIFEIDKFAHGTEEIAKTVGSVKATTVVGGGDSVAAIMKFKLSDKITHISTGGGASLEFLEGKVLPGVEVLEDA
ncbi:MAG: phosphoglycerate kinase [Spirochaetes bacterium]|nr:phosphoglycerate kinase [Spirochaetota bacterium]